MFPLNQNSKLEAFLGSSPASPIQWSVGYIDLPPQTDAATEQQRGNTFRSVSNATSDVTICPYPGQKSSTATSGQPAWVRNILYVKGYNPNASAVTAAIQINDGNDDVQWTGPIPAGGMVYYEDKNSWLVMTAAGQIVMGAGVSGPGTSTDNAAARFDGATGSIIQNSSLIIDDSGNVSSFGGQITFPASQSASAGANTLDDYEEGTWTPTDASGAALSFSAAGGNYTKVGNRVIYSGNATYPATADGSSAAIGGLPFTVGAGNDNRAGYRSVTTESTLALVYPNASATSLAIGTSTNASITNATLSTDLIFMGGQYHV